MSHLSHILDQLEGELLELAVYHIIFLAPQLNPWPRIKRVIDLTHLLYPVTPVFPSYRCLLAKNPIKPYCITCRVQVTSHGHMPSTRGMWEEDVSYLGWERRNQLHSNVLFLS